MNRIRKTVISVLIAMLVSILIGCSAMALLSQNIDSIVDEKSSDSTGTPGINVSPSTGLVINEGESTTSFEITLGSKPTDYVSLEIESQDTSEGVVNRTTVVFDPIDWDTVMIIEITGVDDDSVDGDIEFTIMIAPAVSDDPDYSGIDPQDVTVKNVDNDTPGILVQPTSGLLIGESGTEDQFSIKLLTRPASAVTIPLESSDTTEAVISIDEVIIEPDDWNTPVIVTVTGVDDFLYDGTQLFSIVTKPAVSNDPDYRDFDPDDIGGQNSDYGDGPGISLSGTSGISVSEGGTNDSFSIVLNNQPTGDVSITIESSDTSEALISPSSVVFSDTNWSTLRTIAISGVNDDVDDDDQSFVISISVDSSDLDYNEMDVSDLTGSNEDNDTAGVSLSRSSGLLVYEDTSAGGQSLTFTVVLDSEPLSDVVIPITCSDTSEATFPPLSPTSLTFTKGNWDSAQVVDVIGVDDSDSDGSQDFRIELHDITSVDSKYSVLGPLYVDGQNGGETRKVSIPVINRSGTYTSTQICSITCTPPDSVIHYTSGTVSAVPGTSSPEYSSALFLSAPLTVINARAYYQDWAPSNVAEEEIRIPYIRTTVKTNLVNDGSRGIAISPDNSYMYLGSAEDDKLKKFDINGNYSGGSSDLSVSGDPIDIHWTSHFIVLAGDPGLVYATSEYLSSYSKAYLFDLNGETIDYGYSGYSGIIGRGVNEGSFPTLDLKDYVVVNDGGKIKTSLSTSNSFSQYDLGSLGQSDYAYGADGLVITNIGYDAFNDVYIYSIKVFGFNSNCVPYLKDTLSLSSAASYVATMSLGDIDYILTITHKSVGNYIEQYQQVDNGGYSLVHTFSIPENLTGMDMDTDGNLYVLTDGGTVLRYDLND